MLTAALAALSILTLPAAAGMQQKPRVHTFESLLRDLVDLDWLATPPAPGEACVQFSSYDRASLAGAGKPDAWFANGDAGQYLRKETRNGVDEFVMVEAEGPGAIVRIWSANPSGDLHFYFDGESSPRWTVAFQALCGGKAPFVEPLCGVRSRGWNCYIPIPFERSVKVTATKGGFYYHVNVRRFAEGERTQTFDKELLTSPALVKTAEALASAPDADGLQRTAHTGVKLEPGKAFEARIEGPCTLRRFTCEPAFEDLTDGLRATRLEVFFDGEENPSVSSPIGDFFGTAPGWSPYATAVMRVDKNKLGSVRFPMPFERSALVRVSNDGERPVKLHLEWLADRKSPVAAMRFRAKYRQAFSIPTQPRRDYVVLDAAGPGRFVGCSLSVRNPVKTWWGEGDEHFFVDGEAFPSTFGTGTEDYFGYAWCDPAPFASAFHSQARCDGPGNRGFTSVNRFHLGDSVPFAKSFRFDLEVWHWAETEVDYASVAYWYAAPGAKDLTPPLPAAAERLARPLPPVASKVSGAIEAELLLTRVKVTGGKAQVQDVSGFGDGWSRDEHLWWTGGKPGDRLDLTFDVEAAGEYVVTAQLTKAPDYAVVALTLDGAPLGAELDGYDRKVVATGELELGRVKLDKGPHVLGLAIRGANPKAIPSYMAGLDYLRLLPAGAVK